jgi:hypothetical protein
MSSFTNPSAKSLILKEVEPELKLVGYYII